MKRKLTTSITATGVTESVLIDEGALSISGTFTGTLKIQRQVGGTWVDIESFTSGAQKLIRNGAPMLMRGNCTVYSSGPIELSMVGREADD